MNHKEQTPTKQINIVFIKPTEFHRHIVKIPKLSIEVMPGKTSERSRFFVDSRIKPFITKAMLDDYNTQRNRPHEGKSRMNDAIYVKGTDGKNDTIFVVAHTQNAGCCKPLTSDQIKDAAKDGVCAAKAIARVKNKGNFSLQVASSFRVGNLSETLARTYLKQVNAESLTLNTTNFTKRIKAIKQELNDYLTTFDRHTTVVNLLNALNKISTPAELATSYTDDTSELKTCFNAAIESADERKFGTGNKRAHKCSMRFMLTHQLKDLAEACAATPTRDMTPNPMRSALVMGEETSPEAKPAPADSAHGNGQQVSL